MCHARLSHLSGNIRENEGGLSDRSVSGIDDQ